MYENPHQFSESQSQFYLTAEAGRLEVLTSTPTPCSRNITAIICHPHPLFKGTMHNKVVTTLAKAYSECGIRTVRFNFRGVGASEGSFGYVEGEIADLMAIIRWVQSVRPSDELFLAGFSFGSYIAASVTSTLSSVRSLISIAPPVQSNDFASFLQMPCPWLIVQGEEDEVVPAREVFAFTSTLDPKQVTVRKLPNAGHFFHGRLVELKEIVKEFLAICISEPPSF